MEYANNHWFWFAMATQNQPVISMNGQSESNGGVVDWLFTGRE